jgi:hypothetical protein
VHHYVYYSYEEWGRGYIGVRSCRCSPEKDPYLGSYRDKTFFPTEKIIISEFKNRQEAEKTEKTLQEFFSVVKNPHFANQAINLLVGFSRLGAKATREHIESKKVYFFESINSAARELSLNAGNISNLVVGRQKTTDGFRLVKSVK